MAAVTTTLWNLPPRELPPGDIRATASVTVWTLICLPLMYFFPRGNNKDFEAIRLSIYCILSWSLFTVVDGWLHYDGRAVKYGYVIVGPVMELFRVGSTVELLWGIYSLVHAQWEPRLELSTGAVVWLASKFAIFVVVLLAGFYTSLYICQAVVWVSFLSLDIIDNVATKRMNFKISMAAFTLAFSSLTTIASGCLFFSRGRLHGHIPIQQVYLLLASFVLSLRSAIEFAIYALVSRNTLDIKSATVAVDISFGGLACAVLYLLASAAWKESISSTLEADLRGYIIAKLYQHVSTGVDSQDVPIFKLILDEVSRDLQDRPDTVLLPSTVQSLRWGQLHISYREAGLHYIRRLEGEFGSFEPKRKNETDSREIRDRAGRVLAVNVTFLDIGDQ